MTITTANIANTKTYIRIIVKDIENASNPEAWLDFWFTSCQLFSRSKYWSRTLFVHFRTLVWKTANLTMAAPSGDPPGKKYHHLGRLSKIAKMNIVLIRLLTILFQPECRFHPRDCPCPIILEPLKNFTGDAKPFSPQCSRGPNW